MSIEPVRKKITVPATMDDAFAVFTQKIGSWWPHETHSIGGERTKRVIMEGELGGRLYEIVDDGTEHDWGAVLVWDPPRQVTLSWHVSRGPEVYTEIEVTFEASDDGTVVSLEHRHWERLGDEGAALRDEYHKGWDPVLAEYRKAAAG